ncbi:D-alanine--D-alanine ligase family protein [Legionella micdadei]|uniref:D-alanine--D-alanine ligase n=1 Tax=Legionella micdadei TaxID=451 RepID=A0A098GCH0_LEGMI|nr:D-alanine--D-alanine ligase family protein [Legionella micdadei]ARG96471.1 D-alanine--D-alanine ligase A [Legionella micdadei]ARG99221.1 D-alanine--D-alanine ligase A [Legionella micdadei]KTD29436.1 D-alanine--D-alanine ligase A [Legionella micdadei]NSL18166.1 D-alanine--D-alanine ligase [Legionella micdadei]CEG59682.1 D-alanine--D-alanine ligase [Legionella micdadei]
MSKINLALLYGGKSGEHEISLISAASVLAHLDTNKYNIIPIGMDKDGRFYQNDYQELLAYKEGLPVITPRSRPLASLLVDGHFAVDAEIAFPVVHGPLYEDGCLQGILELAGVAYVGCDVLSSAIGMDKDIARRIACNDEIRSARYRVLSWHSSAQEKQQFCQQVAAELGWPLFVKPCSLGSSVGTHKVKNSEELSSAIEDALRYDETILVEEYIPGREIELAVLEGKVPSAPPRVSIAGEICVNHADGFYSYTAKYLESHQTELHVPAKLDEKITKQLQGIAAEIFTRLKCKGMARVDFFVNEQEGDIYFNEINTLPGFTSISMYPKLWQASGLAYSELLDELVSLAMTHHRCRRQLVTSYQ